MTGTFIIQELLCQSTLGRRRDPSKCCSEREAIVAGDLEQQSLYATTLDVREAVMSSQTPLSRWNRI